jgi:hypothetical protein
MGLFLLVKGYSGYFSVFFLTRRQRRLTLETEPLPPSSGVREGDTYDTERSGRWILTLDKVYPIAVMVAGRFGA